MRVLPRQKEKGEGGLEPLLRLNVEGKDGLKRVLFLLSGANEGFEPERGDNAQGAFKICKTSLFPVQVQVHQRPVEFPVMKD
jgi:hypothetical protein